MRFLTITVLAFVMSAGTAFSQSVEIGMELPLRNHALAYVDGSNTSLDALVGSQGTAVVFWSHSCPWVRRYEDRLGTLAGELDGGNISLILINPNDAAQSPEDAREAIGEHLAEIGYGHTYLIDEGGVLAQAFGATRTPQVFIFDAGGLLVYEGAIDDSPSDAGGVSEAYLNDAVRALAAGEMIDVVQTRSFGCNIKFP